MHVKIGEKLFMYIVNVYLSVHHYHICIYPVRSKIKQVPGSCASESRQLNPKGLLQLHVPVSFSMYLNPGLSDDLVSLQGLHDLM